MLSQVAPVLHSIEIPGSVTSIWKITFSGYSAKDVTRISVDANNPKYDSEKLVQSTIIRNKNKRFSFMDVKTQAFPVV